MVQRPVTETSPPLEVSKSAQDNDGVRPSGELRIERSRFSRFLARFGLGELTDPILRPTKNPAGRGRTG
jgi:hypothetical protein